MGFLEISRPIYPRSIFHLIPRRSYARSRTRHILSVFMPTGASWILGLLKFWSSVHSSEKGFGSRSTPAVTTSKGWLHWADVLLTRTFLHCLQGQIPLLAWAPVLPFIWASGARCTTLRVWSVKHHKSCVSCLLQAFLEADLLWCHSFCWGVCWVSPNE